MKRVWLGAWALMLGLAAVRADNLTAGETGKKLVPWIEVNVAEQRLRDAYPDLATGPADQRLVREVAVEVMKSWAPLTDTIVISSKHGEFRGLYPFLMRNKPAGMKLIGGLKTYDLPGTAPGDPRPYNFSDRAGWRQIGEDAKEIARLTGQPICVLENETSLTLYQDGKTRIDYPWLIEALLPLRETGVQFWWNLPQILPDGPEFPTRQEETTKLVKAIATALPDSIFLTEYTGWIGWRQHPPGEAARRQAMIDAVGLARMSERLFVTNDGYWHYSIRDKSPRRNYTAEEAVVELSRLPGPTIIIYPDPYSWISVANEMAQRMGQAP